jgi:hypothetical protein
MRLPFSNPIDYLGIGIALACQKTKSATAPNPALPCQMGPRMAVKQAVLGWSKAAKQRSGPKKAPGLDIAARAPQRRGCQVVSLA